jgi:hypothetical protein
MSVPAYATVASKLQDIAETVTGVKGVRITEDESIPDFPYILIMPRRCDIATIGMPNHDRHVMMYEVLIVTEDQDILAGWETIMGMVTDFYSKIHSNYKLDNTVSAAHVDGYDAGYKPRSTFVRKFAKVFVSVLAYAK